MSNYEYMFRRELATQLELYGLLYESAPGPRPIRALNRRYSLGYLGHNQAGRIFDFEATSTDAGAVALFGIHGSIVCSNPKLAEANLTYLDRFGRTLEEPERIPLDEPTSTRVAAEVIKAFIWADSVDDPAHSLTDLHNRLKGFFPTEISMPPLQDGTTL